jgi:hypothetical protein
VLDKFYVSTSISTEVDRYRLTAQMAALMASFQWNLPIDGAAIILTAVSVAVSPINPA